MVQPKVEKLKDRPIQAPDWLELEIDGLSVLARLVLKHTKQWIDRHIRTLREGNVHLSYQLMGNMDSHSEATERSSQAHAEEGGIQQEEDENSKEKNVPKKSRIRKRKEVQPEEPQQKRPRVEEAQLPANSSSVQEVEMLAQMSASG